MFSWTESVVSSLRSALDIPSTHVPISPATFASYIVPLLVCYLAIAVLAVTPQTHAFRIALWPIIAWLALRAVHIDMSSGKPELKLFNGELLVRVCQRQRLQNFMQ